MATIDYGTQRFIRNSGAPRPVGQLAASMNNTGARVGELNPGLVVPGGNVQAQNVGQPMRRLDYGAPLAAPPPNPGNLPPSSTTTQTGQGGGQSQIVGASEGQQGQAQGVGRQPGTSATMPVYTGSVHPADPGTAHRAPGTSSTMPVNTSTSRPQPPVIPTNPADPNATHLDANGNMVKANGSVVSYNAAPGQAPDNWYGQLSGAPQAPTGGDATQRFNTAAVQSGSTPTGQKFLANIGKYGEAGANRYLSQPGSYTVADFNKVAQSNPTLAVQMAGSSQQFRDAIMKSNNWTNQQMNQFINAHGSQQMPGITNEALTAAGYTGPFGAGYHPTAPPPAPPPPPATTPPATTPPAAPPPGQPGPYQPLDPYWLQFYGQH